MQRAWASGLLIGLGSLLCCVRPALAQDVNDYRGGWIADDGDVRHVYMLVAGANNGFTGIYCTDCSNPANLAIVDDGQLGKDGIRFKVYGSTATGAVTDEAGGKAANGALTLTRKTADGRSKTLTFHRSPTITYAKPAQTVGAPPPAPKPYVSPATAVQVSAANVVGLWLSGNGPGKQYFMFRHHKNGVHGMVCGPCGDTANMGVLENVRWEGDRLHFDIAHEDNGPDIAAHGPHKNVTTAIITRNEMHLWVVPSFEKPGFTPLEMTLLGPVTYQP